MNVKLFIEMKLLSQLFNAKYLNYEILNDYQLQCNSLIFMYKKDFFNNIEIVNVDNDYTLEKTIKGYSIEKEINKIKKLVDGSVKGYIFYQYNHTRLLKQNHIFKIDDLFEKDLDEFNRLCNKIISRDTECDMYPFIYYNEVPEKYNVSSVNYINIPFLQCREDEISNIKLYNDIGLGFPIHPMNMNKHICDKYDINYRQCFVSSSNRTFTSKDIPFYFKIDLPCRVSGSKRTLTRSDNRIKASKIARDNLECFNRSHALKLYLLEDLGYIEKDQYTYVIRNKEKIRQIPLHTLMCNSMNFDFTCLDWLISTNNQNNVLSFVLNNIVCPLIDVFEFFLGISLPYKKFIQPYNYHKQNLGIALGNSNQIIGIYAQDFDMDVDLTPANICVEFDTMLTQQILCPIMNYLNKFYNVKIEEFELMIKEYIKQSCPNILNVTIAEEVVNRSFHLDFLYKDIFDKKKPKYWIGKTNPLRVWE